MVADKTEEILSSLNDEQKLCVKNLDGKFLVLAGPGTGKTTIIKTLIRLMQDEGLEIALCAPTGRAAKLIT